MPQPTGNGGEIGMGSGREVGRGGGASGGGGRGARVCGEFRDLAVGGGRAGTPEGRLSTGQTREDETREERKGERQSVQIGWEERAGKTANIAKTSC